MFHNNAADGGCTDVNSNEFHKLMAPFAVFYCLLCISSIMKTPRFVVKVFA